MGYTTEFSGELFFNDKTTDEAKEFFSRFFDEDGRDHPEWGAEDLCYFDYEFCDEDLTGICWNGAEKSYDMIEKLQLMINLTKEKFPEFGFIDGELMAVGENRGDVWKLVVKNNIVSKEKVKFGKRNRNDTD